MIQPYCRERTVRDGVVEECGRVLDTAGRCDRAAQHVSEGRR